MESASEEARLSHAKIRPEHFGRSRRKRWMIGKKRHALKNKMRFESAAGKAGVYAE
ncbi:MAG: hypothetical protein LBH85_02870 [Treponema sp.]|jgi:hypothetical protein|nr:hypothetical protein [Treponema sp.]